MHLLVNGNSKEFPDVLSITRMLEVLDIRADRVAVEVNKAVVPRAQHAHTLLHAGDEVEVVTFVGGG